MHDGYKPKKKIIKINGNTTKNSRRERSLKTKMWNGRRNETLLYNQKAYVILIKKPKLEKKKATLFTNKNENINKNSPINPIVPGNPILANVAKNKNKVKIGM